MTTISDLPEDLADEIFSRIPLTSLSVVRSTCKKWDALSKTRIFGKAAAAGKKQFLGFMVMDSRVCSLRFDLQGIRDDGDFVDPSIKQVSIFDQVEISKVFQCDGLLLCIIKNDNSRLLVWNPYLGQTMCVQPMNSFHRVDRYALGYDNNNYRNHKILRFIDNYLLSEGKHVLNYEIYDFSSNLWRVLDVTPDWNIGYYQRSVSVKGNSYFFAQEKIKVVEQNEIIREIKDFLLSFDFTTERFGPRLPLPFHSYLDETVTLSCLREEQLVVLYQPLQFIGTMEIWVTTKIDPNEVSWSMFLKVDMKPLTGFQFDVESGTFFIDQEKKVAVVFDLDGIKPTETLRYQTAHIIGQDGYFKSVNIGEAPNLGKPDKFGYYTPLVYCLPLVCSSSYAPSLVQLQSNQATNLG